MWTCNQIKALCGTEYKKKDVYVSGYYFFFDAKNYRLVAVVCIDFVSHPISSEITIRLLHVLTAPIQHLSMTTTTMMTLAEKKKTLT